MKWAAYEDDPVAYRIGYSRIAQRLHLRSVVGATTAEEKREGRKGDEEQGGPPPRLVELVESLIGAQASPGRPASIDPDAPRWIKEEEPDPIQGDALRLIFRTAIELAKLGLPYPGLTWGGVRREFHRGETKRLAKFLARVLEPATVVLLYSAWIEDGYRADWLLDVRGPKRRPPKRPKRRRLRNKLPLWRRYVVVEIDEPWLRQYMETLLHGVERGRLRRICGWKVTGKVNYRVQYNLACMYSRLATPPKSRAWLNVPARSSTRGDEREAALALAIGHLRAAMCGAHGNERKALSAWAEDDPALASVRDLRREDFDAALTAAADADRARVT
jgi:hypothetical protein